MMKGCLDGIKSRFEVEVRWRNDGWVGGRKEDLL